MVNLRVRLGSLTLANPVLAAAGTMGYGIEFAARVRVERLGAVITKTLTRHPRPGHPPPRLTETPAGMLNAVGLQNMGLAAFLQDTLPTLRALRVPIIVSLLGESAEDAEAMARLVEGAEGVAAVEVNLSCPNVRAAGQGAHRGFVPIVAQDPAATRVVVAAVCRATRKPVIAKLSPDVTDLVPVAQAAQEAGACAVTVGNTFVGMSLDPGTQRSRLGVMTGGLSGPAIRPLALYRVWYTAQNIDIPVIGLGGIVRVEDALEFFLAGAAAVAVGTATFARPDAAVRVADGLARYLQRHKLESIDALRGVVNRA